MIMCVLLKSRLRAYKLNLKLLEHSDSLVKGKKSKGPFTAIKSLLVVVFIFKIVLSVLCSNGEESKPRILASLSRICRSDTFSSLGSFSSLLRRAQFLFGDGLDCEEEELDVLAALALRLDIKIGFPGGSFTEQKTRVRPPV